MGQTITEKILARAARRDLVEPGETIEARIDTVMMHDVTSSGAIKILKKEFDNRVCDELNVVVAPDHHVPNKDVESAVLYKELIDFAREHKLRYVYPVGPNYGVCHVMLPEEGLALPGHVIVGGDSHTCTYGALGAFSTGIGTTEVANVLATGKLWFIVPESYRFWVDGNMPNNVMAKDLFLYVVGDIGVDGASYMAMEWDGPTIRKMPIDERLTLTNMAIEAGAKSGIIAPDEITFDYIDSRTDKTVEPFYSDKDAKYSKTKKIDASSLEPLVAKPYLPSNVVAASELKNVKIDQAYIGGCTGGKYEDFKAAADVLKGHKAARNVRLLILPSTQKIYRRLLEEGLIDMFMKAGAVIGPPTCGACLGGHMGVLGPGEIAISVTNRNFRGRMGYTYDPGHGRNQPDSLVYLASPKTVAASAIEGYIRGAAL